MAFPIDVIYVDRDYRIVRLAPAAQVYVEYAERSPRGLVRQAVAHRLRASLPGTY